VPVGLAIPLLGIFQITFLNVQDAVQSGRQGRVIALNEVVRLGPLPSPQVNQDLVKMGVVHGSSRVQVGQPSRPQTRGVWSVVAESVVDTPHHHVSRLLAHTGARVRGCGIAPHSLG
jgi:hypothetical protein